MLPREEEFQESKRVRTEAAEEARGIRREAAEEARFIRHRDDALRKDEMSSAILKITMESTAKK